MRIIDISLPIEPSPPDYERKLSVHHQAFPPILQKVEIYPIWVPKWDQPLPNGRRVSKLHTPLHAGTHVEAPAHMLEQGKMIHEYPLDRFVSPATVINMTYKADHSTISASELDKEGVDENDSIIIRTDFTKRIGTKGVAGTTQKHWIDSPKLTKDAIDWMAEKKVRILTTDFLPWPLPGELFVHLMSKDILYIENVGNLDQITKKKVTLVALPLKIFDVEATLTRAIVIEH
ncbi:MAG: cyclase family protein [Thaumarchaeota archaeon]|nr:cyclase family protein [Nitrososphaerota archaeon]